MLHYALNYKSYKHPVPHHLFLISFLVFISLNIIENVYHYSIGRLNDSKKIELVMPSKLDWVHIIIVMIVFGLLQAFFMCLFVGCD